MGTEIAGGLLGQRPFEWGYPLRLWDFGATTSRSERHQIKIWGGHVPVPTRKRRRQRHSRHSWRPGVWAPWAGGHFGRRMSRTDFLLDQAKSCPRVKKGLGYGPPFSNHREKPRRLHTQLNSCLGCLIPRSSLWRRLLPGYPLSSRVNLGRRS